MHLIIALLLATPLAHACGGFFCSNSAPVLQAAERIAFMVHDKTDANVLEGLSQDRDHYERRVQKSLVTAIIQIAYSGPAHEFSWVLPLPSVPDKIDVSDDRLFVNLEQATRPTFSWGGFKHNSAACPSFERGPPIPGCQPIYYAPAGGNWEVNAASGTSLADDDGVVVVASGEAGAYVYEVVVDQSRDGGKMFKWLNDNGYDQPPSSERLIQHYAKQQMPFVAVKLQSDKDTGDIQPLMLTYPADTMSCIPLRLTAIAATESMPIYSWVLGSSRAVTTNYFNVEVDPLSIDWLQCATRPTPQFFLGLPFSGFQPPRGCGAAYQERVSEAVKAVGGRAFVTEYAGASSVYQPIGARMNTTSLRTARGAAELIRAMMAQGFVTSPTLQSIFRRMWPMPNSGLSSQCAQERTFYAQWNVDKCVKEAGITVDVDAVVDEIDELIAKPVKRTDKLMQSLPYLTRLYTTMGPEDMTRDPFMKFTDKLGDVRAQHSAVAYADCTGGFVKEETTVATTTTTAPASAPTAFHSSDCRSYLPVGPRITHASSIRVVVNEEHEKTYRGEFKCTPRSSTPPPWPLYELPVPVQRVTLLNETDGSEIVVPMNKVLALDAQLTDTFEQPCPEIYKICEENGGLATALADCTFDCTMAVQLGDLWMRKAETEGAGLSAGAIVGIVVAVAFVVVVGIIIVVQMRRSAAVTPAQPTPSSEMKERVSSSTGVRRSKRRSKHRSRSQQQLK